MHLNSFLKQVQEISVALGLHLRIGDEAERRAVDAVAHAVGGFRIAGEHMTKVRISGTASDLRAAHTVTQILQLHHGRLLDGLGKGGPAAAALKLVRGGKERLAGDDIHIDALFKLVPELAREGALRAALLRDAVLLRRQLVPDGLRRGLLIVARVDAQSGKELHLRARDVAVAVRILFEVVLVVFLGGIVILERADLHEKFLAAAALDLRDALYRFSRAFVGVVDAGLVLTAPVVALLVLHRGVDDIEVGQQQRVEAHLPGVVFHPHGLPKAGLSLADGLVIGVRLAGAVGVAALGVDDAGDGLHQLFHSPEAAARQIYDIFRGIHIHASFTGHIRGLSGHFLLVRFLRHIFLPGSAAAQQQYRGEQKRQYSPIHGVSLLSEKINSFVSPYRRQEPGR